jgi:predicted nuclease with RNAse H fold
MAQLIFGIDYGAKNSGFTRVFAGKDEENLCCYRIEKGKDTDQWLSELIEEQKPALIAIDAPLSLPGVYQKLKGFTDFFYRHCDRELGAMSPMFLGGLSARAMKLRSQYPHVNFIESYPSAFVKTYYPAQHQLYKKDYSAFLEQHGQDLINDVDMLQSNHDLDAIICWHIGKKYLDQNTKVFGKPEEGLIYV